MRLALKVLMVMVMTLAILVPLVLIRGTIHERQGYRNDTVRDVAANFGGRQIVGGPVLVVPYTEMVDEDVADAGGEVKTIARRKQGSWVFFPETLSVTGELQPDVRRRGLHDRKRSRDGEEAPDDPHLYPR